MDSNSLIKAITTVTKDWTKQRKAEERNQSAEMNRIMRITKQQRVTQKSAAWEYMEKAYMKASGNNTLPALARQIMYACRPYILQETGIQKLDDEYFTQTLLPDYMIAYPDRTRNWDVVFDARGHFHEPHTGKTVDLGTLQVRRYLANIRNRAIDRKVDPDDLIKMYPTIGPKHRYTAILFIEKEGFIPLFERVNLAERYDLAIMSAKGMSNTSARHLVDSICGQNEVKLLIMRDFDKAGFSIAATIQQDTRRYEFSHCIEAIDLGLRLDDVKAYNLNSETQFFGQTDPRLNLKLNGATTEEIDFLVDRRNSYSGHYVGQRVELNEFDSPTLIKWIEAKLDANGIKKVLPDIEVLKDGYRRAFIQGCCAKAAEEAREDAEDKLKKEGIPDDLTVRVENYLAKHPKSCWDKALIDIVECADDDDESA